METIGDFTTAKLKVDLSGASKMLVGGDFLAKEKLDIELSGASNLKGQMTSPESTFDISGASNLSLKGNTIHCKMEVSGASKANLEDFPINELKAEVSGAAKALSSQRKNQSTHLRCPQKLHTPAIRSSSPCTHQELRTLTRSPQNSWRTRKNTRNSY